MPQPEANQVLGYTCAPQHLGAEATEGMEACLRAGIVQSPMHVTLCKGRLPFRVENRYPDLSATYSRSTAAKDTGMSIMRIAAGVLGSCSRPCQIDRCTDSTRQSGERSPRFSASASPMRRPVPASKANSGAYRGSVFAMIAETSVSLNAGLGCFADCTIGIPTKS